MLGNNIRTIRKAKALSQEALAQRLHVVRQTVSKWEQGLSVPDSDLLIALSEILETPVSVLLGEAVAEPSLNEASAPPPDEIKRISEALEAINLQLARQKAAKRKILHGIWIIIAILILATAACLIRLKSPYLDWNYSDPETAILGTAYHAFEFFFFRLAPFALLAAIIGAILTGKAK